MKDILQDVVAHTHALGFVFVKVTNEEGTQIDSMAEDLQCYSSAETHSKVGEVPGEHLVCPT